METLQQTRYLATTDFELITACMQQELSPVQFRILHYINSCLAHDIKNLDLVEASDWLGITEYELYCHIKALEAKGVLQGFHFSDEQTLGGNENV